jgi:hypothetical protein
VKTYVMTETQFNAQLLTRVLAVADLPEHLVVESSTRSGAISLGGTLLSRRGAPVVVVLNADSVEPRSIREQEEAWGFLLRVAPAPARVMMAVPQVEGVVFGEAKALGCILGRELTEMELLEARFRPRAVLERLLVEVGMDRAAFIGCITPRAAARFAEHPLVRSLADFIRHPRAQARKAA